MTKVDWGDYEGEGFKSWEISNHERALILLHEYDLEAQLLAIRNLLRRNRESDRELGAEIKELESAIRKSEGDYADYLQHTWIDRLHGSVFQDAAHSMSATGMLAPFVESLFVSLFKSLRDRVGDASVPSDARKTRSSDDYWDPHYVFDERGRRKDIAKGITQLSHSTGLTPFFPCNFTDMLDALFIYRNKMFHNGFEWPLEERCKFERTLREKNWPSNWFRKSSSGDKAWIFYLSPEFIEQCLTMIDQLLNGVGAFLSQHE